MPNTALSVVLVCLLHAQPARPPLPKVQVTNAKVAVLQAAVDEIDRLLGPLELVAEPLDFQVGRRDPHEDIEENLSALRARALVLCRLYRQFSQALDARLSLEREIAQYEGWLRSVPVVGNGPPESPGRIAQLRSGVRVLTEQFKVLIHLEAEYLKELAEKSDPSQADALKAKARLYEEKIVGPYYLVPNRNQHEDEFQYLSPKERRARIGEVSRDLRRSRDAYKRARNAGENGSQGNLDAEQFLKKDSREALREAKDLLGRTASYPEHAEYVADNALYAARVLAAVDWEIEDLKLITFMREARDDGLQVEKLNRIVEGRRSAPFGLDLDLDEEEIEHLLGPLD